MKKRVAVALGLSITLALVVFNVTFDRQTRAAGHAFVAAQIRRHAGGLPVATINEGFRPMVRSAALRSGGWLGLVAGVGVAVTVVAARSSRK